MNRKSELQTFTDPEVAFLAEYEEVMRPLATKLDRLQGDDMYSVLGVLLPQIGLLKEQLKRLLRKGKLRYTKPIVDAVLEGLDTRFSPTFELSAYQMASCFHPTYKLSWVKMWDPARLPAIREEVVTMVANELRAQDPQAQTTLPVTAERHAEESQVVFDSDDEDTQMLQLMRAYQQETTVQPTKTYTDVARELVKTWESSEMGHKFDDSAFMGNSTFIKLFLQTNTGLVTSAAVERFFSQGKDTLRAKKPTLFWKSWLENKLCCVTIFFCVV